MLSKALSGKVALVTGSTSGIGLGIAKVFASRGCNVMLNGLGDACAIESLQTNMQAQHHVQVAYHPADLTKKAEIRDMVEHCKQKFGSLDILVNNAGIQHVAPVENFPDDRWETVLSLNLSSNFYAIKAVLPMMKARGYGRIINIASAHGKVASVFKSAYVASKHGVLGLTKVVALECAGTGITCNAICPGWVLTPLVQAQIEERAKKYSTTIEDETFNLLAEKQPSKQFVHPEDLGEFAAFLASPAANQVTGATLSVDGGWTAI